MYHPLVFRCAFTGDRETSPKDPLERLRVEAGARLPAQVRPYVVETGFGPVEVADLFFEDGTATRGVPFACFRFDG
jgi:hypothetical protein